MISKVDDTAGLRSRDSDARGAIIDSCISNHRSGLRDEGLNGENALPLLRPKPRPRRDMVSLDLVVCENLARGQGEGSDLTVDNRSGRDGESGQSSSEFGPSDCTEVSFFQHLNGAEIACSTTGYALSSVLTEGLFVDVVSHGLNNVWGVEIVSGGFESNFRLRGPSGGVQFFIEKLATDRPVILGAFQIGVVLRQHT